MLYLFGVVLLVIAVVLSLLDHFKVIGFDQLASGSLGAIGIVFLVVGFEMSRNSFSFNRVIEELMEQERQGLVPTISKAQFDEYTSKQCIVLKKEKDAGEKGKALEEEVAADDIVMKQNGEDEVKNETGEAFHWGRRLRRGRCGHGRCGGRFRGYPYYRYWRIPYSRFIRYPYRVTGPARWVTYDGDYYYVTI